MSAVLSARSRLKEAKATHASASREFDRHFNLAFDASSPPATTEVVEVQAFLTELEAHHVRHQRALIERHQEEVRLTLAEVAWSQVTNQLAEEVAAAKEKPELSEDRVLLGAIRMSELARPPSKEVEGPQTANKEVEELLYSSELSRLEEALRKALVEISVTCARAMKLAPRLENAKKALANFQKPDIKFPVRPTEEEVQRFLQQTEQFMVSRLEAHRHLIALLAKRAELLKLLEEQQEKTLADSFLAFKKQLDMEIGESVDANSVRKLIFIDDVPVPSGDDANDANDDSDDSDEEESGTVLDVNTKALLAYFKLVYERFSESAKAALGDEYDTSNLDSYNVPKAGLSDRGKIDEIRKLMHTYAVACGHLNESKQALEDAQNIPEKKVEVKGVGHVKTWQECMDWREDIQRQQDEAERHNETRSERIDLLTEAFEEYNNQKVRAKRVLHRFVITVIPPADQPAADELRILTNAAAWMANPDSDVSEGGYPVY